MAGRLARRRRRPLGADELTVRHLQTDATAHRMQPEGFQLVRTYLLAMTSTPPPYAAETYQPLVAIKAMGRGLLPVGTSGATCAPAVQRVAAQLKPDGGIVGIGRRDRAPRSAKSPSTQSVKKASCASGTTSRFRCCLRGDGG